MKPSSQKRFPVEGLFLFSEKLLPFSVMASIGALTGSDAEAQTVGMERRQERRAGRHERRDERRTGRTERREERRTGTAAGTSTNTGAGTTTGSAK